MQRAAVFGWGVVAPRSRNIEEFTTNLECGESWLAPFNGFGPDNFLCGTPKFDFREYQPWLAQRFPPSRFRQLADKMDPTTLYALGAFIQALGFSPGLEPALRELGEQAHVYVATALGCMPTIYDESLKHHRAQRRWNRFWADASRNGAYRRYAAGEDTQCPLTPPATITDPDEREAAEDAWFAYWAERSEQLQVFLADLREVESVELSGEVESAKLSVMREKRRGLARVTERWGAPPAPWGEVSANIVWNITNTPSAQISMLGGITGPCFAPVAACSTFGVCLKLALGAIERGEAKLAIAGACDPPPHPLTVGGFYSARVLAADGQVSKPLTSMKGTHVSGGAVVWIVGDLEYGLARGFKPLGLEPVAVGLSADADHIITPSSDGPRRAMRSALGAAGARPEQVGTWDLHATGTPGDFQELSNLQSVVPPHVLVTAHKGMFGHGMGVGSGWELTAQYLGYERGRLFPTTLTEGEVNAAIRELKQALVFDSAEPFPECIAGKLSMGVGGINACIISRPWPNRAR
jgi:3-oxoacyl-(acyl-carrier-protein) synthase